jgi:hypothetical protein
MPPVIAGVQRPGPGKGVIAESAADIILGLGEGPVPADAFAPEESGLAGAGRVQAAHAHADEPKRPRPGIGPQQAPGGREHLSGLVAGLVQGYAA